MTFLGVALSRMTLGVCKPPLADFGGREKREVFICHHSMMQRPRPHQVPLSHHHDDLVHAPPFSLSCACCWPSENEAVTNGNVGLLINWLQVLQTPVTH